MHLLTHCNDCYLLQLCQGFNGADLRNVCTEAGMSAIRAERDYVIHEDFMKVIYVLDTMDLTNGPHLPNQAQMCCFTVR